MQLPDDISFDTLKTAGKHASGFIEAINRLFPEIPLRSIQNAESKATRKIIKDIEQIKILISIAL